MIQSFLQGTMYPFLFLSMYFQILLFISFFENKKRIKDEESQCVSIYPTVTIAVPCWNEEKTLPRTLDSLLLLDYPKDKLSIIVVDDGSKDNTLSIAKEYEEKNREQIRVMSKENGGKHTAVNLALEESDSELFGCLDADSFVSPKALHTIAAYFENHEKAMAVTPCIHVLNPKTFIQRMQAIEYLMGVFLRKSFGQLDAIQVTPGPFSIFRRKVFQDLGGYRKAHNTEDYEITLRMHKAHYKIMNSHKALVYTVGPSTIKGFFHQRLRWARGFLENSLDYRELFFKKEYGNFGMFTLPVAFLFIFYSLYAASVIVYTFSIRIMETITRFDTVGYYFSMPKFDLFYMSTTTMSFVVMILLTMFLFMLYTGNTLSDDKQEFYKNFPIFFITYPIIVPFFLGRAVWDTFLKRKNEWVLQDTKK